MALTKIKKSFTKFKKSSVKTKVLVAAFVIGFAGLGVYQVANSGAAATGYGVVSVQVAEMNPAGQLTGNNVPNASVTIVANPAALTYNCNQSGAPVGTGTSATSGIAPFTCSTFAGTGKQYTANASKTGYTSRGSYTANVVIGQSTIFRVILQQKDGDGDGVADLSDTCPTVAGIAPSGCPAGVPTARLTVAPTNVAVGARATISWSTTNNPTSCTLKNYYPANSTTPVALKVAASGSLSTDVIKTNAAFSLQCINNYGLSAVDGPKTVTAGTACPAGQSGTPPNCVTVTDIAPPTAPTGLVAVANTGGTINLSWKPATDNVAVTGYKVKLAGWGTVANLTGTTAVLNSAVAGNSYTYTVVAVDAAGNLSPASASITVVAK